MLQQRPPKIDNETEEQCADLPPMNENPDASERNLDETRPLTEPAKLCVDFTMIDLFDAQGEEEDVGDREDAINSPTIIDLFDAEEQNTKEGKDTSDSGEILHSIITVLSDDDNDDDHNDDKTVDSNHLSRQPPTPPTTFNISYKRYLPRADSMTRIRAVALSYFLPHHEVAIWAGVPLNTLKSWRVTWIKKKDRLIECEKLIRELVHSKTKTSG